MYSAEDVAGVNTELMVVLVEQTKGQFRAVISAHNNLSTAYQAKDMADTIAKHYQIEGASELDELFNIFCGNCLIRNIATECVTISNDPKKHETQPLSTTILIGKRTAEALGEGAYPVSVFNFKKNTDTFDALIHLSRRKKEQKRQFAVTADLHASMIGLSPIENLAEVLELWPTTNDVLRVGDVIQYDVRRQVWPTRVQFTIQRVVSDIIS